MTIIAGTRFRPRDGRDGIVEVLSVGQHRENDPAGYEGVRVRHTEDAGNVKEGARAWWALHLFKESYEETETP